MKKYKGRLVGILGTVIFHLIVAIIIMSFQIRSLQVQARDMFEIEFLAEEQPEEEKLIEVPITTIEKILQGDEEMLNIARNLANKADARVNPDDYIDKVKEELIKSGKLSVDNYIDEQKKAADKTDENLAFNDESKVKDDQNKPSESQEMAANYKGPTRIYYELKGRTHTYLPIPIYKCQGSGKVSLRIEVNQKGAVEKTLVITGESTTSDPCLVEAAVRAAVITRFNSDLKAPKIQMGTLTYHFVAQ
ncbi:MAG: hypothetical protein A2X05_05235 [Bacteroidetes bacterium GWE2_41_25]|nr:MAG: hypothetical protein A2X03_09335 [Bacteroidetes bacterium GWA2_40_15]OFX92482.1 MAG: hypothetical protein A2X05_05235 [Bacteroidetes bacterium GWE2_41_25]OFY00535.1 MAG: hypothetical protein A2X06_00345 [Bacteroidetes bacterium GWC2_40_22]OFY59421.1 MAG: hypothetical protein A2X04_12680 [Bacteroidetes bacterium GWF2_41_9]HBH82504.1 hypothetical protein [Bacteroidales bacterium]